RVGVGVEGERPAHAGPFDFARGPELACRPVGSQLEVCRRQLHRDGLGPAGRTRHEPSGTELAEDDHGLPAAVLEGQLLELAALAADDGAIERGDDRREPLRWTGALGTRGGRRGSRRWFLLIFSSSFGSRWGFGPGGGPGGIGLAGHLGANRRAPGSRGDTRRW